MSTDFNALVAARSTALRDFQTKHAAVSRTREDWRAARVAFGVDESPPRSLTGTLSAPAAPVRTTPIPSFLTAATAHRDAIAADYHSQTAFKAADDALMEAIHTAALVLPSANG